MSRSFRPISRLFVLFGLLLALNLQLVASSLPPQALGASSDLISSLPTRSRVPTATRRPKQTPIPPTLASRSLPTVASSSTACTVVELYPGYPGYRGYVAGVDGPGEVACLEDLTADNPGFDKVAEDTANIAAARAIGLNGNPRDWTWENWMVMEAERGLPVTCYSCLFTQLDSAPDRDRSPFNPADPRLQIGAYGTTDALMQAAANAGMGPDASSFFIGRFGGDHVLRAFIGSTWPGNHNAPEMLDAYGILFAGYAEPGTKFLDTHAIWAHMLIQGGYAPTPSTAHIEDQMYMIRTGIEGMCAPGGISSCDLVLQSYDLGVEAAFRQEIIRSGPDITYADWLKENFPDFL